MLRIVEIQYRGIAHYHGIIFPCPSIKKGDEGKNGKTRPADSTSTNKNHKVGPPTEVLVFNSSTSLMVVKN